MLALVLAALVTSALAGSPAEGQTPLDDRVREIAAALRCPVCQNLSVADSPSEMAQQMRAVIRERLEAGESRQEVEAYFLSKYGDWILLAPRRHGFNLVLWLGPFAAAAAGLLVAAYLVRRWARRRPAARPGATDPTLLERVRSETAADAAPVPAEVFAALPPLERERARLYEALRELAFDHRAGKLSGEDYEAMRADYEARAAQALGDLDAGRARDRAGARRRSRGEERAADSESSPASARRRPLRTALAGGFLLAFGVALGVFLVQAIRPRASSMDSMTGDFLTGTGPGGVSPTLSMQGNALERDLEEGRAALDRGDLRMAADHFKGVLAIEPDHPAALSSLALILARGGHTDAAVEAVERALARAPDDSFALWVNGLVLYEAKRDYAGAIRAWEALLEQPLAPDDSRTVTQMLAGARQRLDSGAAAAAPSVPVPARNAGDSRYIIGAVLLGDSLRAAGPPAGTLFVIARRGGGPPLAVKRIVSPQFPVEFSLGPEDVMVQGGEFRGEVTLLARLKRDGRAGPASPGDLEGVAERNPIPVGTTGVRITLETVR